MTLEILVTRAEDGSPVRKTLAQLNVVNVSSLTLLASVSENWDQHQHEISAHFTPSVLTDMYMKSIYKIHRRFLDAFSHTLNSEKLFETLLRAEFMYASPKAYGLIKPVIKKEKEEDQELIPVAHYNNKYEIIISLPENAALDTIKGYGIHEFGHYLHQVYDPQNYKNSDASIKETLAILVQEEEGIDYHYLSNTPHGRAQELLRKANENKFKGKTFAERWRLLTRFQKLEDLEDYIDGIFFIDLYKHNPDYSKHF